MSTPLSIDSPPIRHHVRTDSEQKRDLQEKIQYMITLQHLGGESDGFSHDALSSEGDLQHLVEGPEGTGGQSDRTSGTAGLPTNPNNSLRRSIPETQPQSQLPPPSPHSGVGLGTMIFSNSFQPHRRRENSTESVPSMLSGTILLDDEQRRRQLQVPPPPDPPFPSRPPLPNTNTNGPPRQIYAGGYGSIEPREEVGGLGGTATTLSNNNGTYSDQQYFHPFPHVALQQPDFHYGHDTDFLNPDGNHDVIDERSRIYQHHQHHRSSSQLVRPTRIPSTCAKGCCLHSPLTYILLRENIHRSLCIGAMDGMLTGSGITSAFCALNVLSSTATWEVRMAVVVFSIAACLADALCMAMGHIWTTFLMSSTHAQEHNDEKQLFDSDKSNAKTRLVDMLLARGMLRLDAMSLADTLEGYPDMFVNVLLGDSLFAGMDVPPEDEMEDDDIGQHQNTIGGIHDITTTNTTTTSTVESFAGLSWKFPSYGRFNEMEHDPELHAVSVVWKESQMEGIAMMIGFSTFAIIPSLLWLLIPPLLIPDSGVTSTDEHASLLLAGRGIISSSLSTLSPTKEEIVDDGGGEVISLPSIIISISVVIMLILGGWKSRYIESNWIISGIESVVVLLVCVLSAYGVGYCLCYLIGGQSGLILSNVVRHRCF